MQGQEALITGAGSGIGRAIALALATRGVHIHLVGRNHEALEATAALARSHGTQADCYSADLANDEAIAQLCKQLQAACPAIDILVHSAGMFASGWVEQAPIEEFDLQYRLNVRAPFLLTQVMVPLIRERKGQIVFINSSAGLQARAGVSQYAATKHALKAVADSLRDELNPEGIRVLSVFPGRTASPMQAAIFAGEGRKYHPERLLQPEDVAETVISALGLPRTAEVTDIHIRPLSK